MASSLLCPTSHVFLDNYVVICTEKAPTSVRACISATSSLRVGSVSQYIGVLDVCDTAGPLNAEPSTTRAHVVYARLNWWPPPDVMYLGCCMSNNSTAIRACISPTSSLRVGSVSQYIGVLDVCDTAVSLNAEPSTTRTHVRFNQPVASSHLIYLGYMYSLP